jgi:Flp pilus assembly protein TadG
VGRRNALRIHLKARKGQALIEFTLVAMLILATILGTVDFGRAFFTWASMANAAREGARYGIIYPRRWTATDYPSPNNIEYRARAMLSTLGTTTPQIEIHCLDQWGQAHEYERDWCRSTMQIQVIVKATFQSWTGIIPTLNLVAKSTMIIE